MGRNFIANSFLILAYKDETSPEALNEFSKKGAFIAFYIFCKNNFYDEILNP